MRAGPDTPPLAPPTQDSRGAAPAVPRQAMYLGPAPAASADGTPSRRLLRLALLTLCYYLVAHYSLLLAFAQSNATPVWPPSGMALGALLLLGYRTWPAILLGALGANLVAFHANGQPYDAATVVLSLAIAAGNVLEALSGAWLMRRYTDGAQPLGQMHNVYKFALIAMVMCTVSATIGSTALLLAGVVPGAAFATVIATWWVGDTTGVLLVAPALVAWRLGRPLHWKPALVAEALLSLLLLLGLMAAVFGRRYGPGDGLSWLPYLFVLCVAWSSHRHGLRGASTVWLLAAGGAVLATVHGLGPFASGTLNDALISLESFVALCSLIGLVLCADTSERLRMRAGVQDRIAAQWGTLLIGVGLTVMVWNLISAGTERRARQRFEADCSDIEQRVLRRLALYETGLRGAQAFFKAEPEVTRTKWRDFAAGMDIAGHFPGMLGLGYGQYVQAAQRPALEAAVRAEGYPGFRIWGAQTAAPAAAEEPEPAVAVVYLEPFSGSNVRPFGFDMLSEPARRAAIMRAAASGQAALSDKVTLLQDSKPAPGFLMYLPIYQRLAPQDSPAQRLAALRGVAYAPIRADDLMRGIMESNALSVRLEIFDGDSSADEQLLYASSKRGAGERAQYLNPYQRQQLQPMQQITAHGWTLRFTSLPAFEDTVDRQKSHIVLLTGIVISLLFFGVVRALAARQAYATALAEDMTGALRESEASLIVARDLAEAASRAKTEFVANMSHEIRTPLNAVLGMTHLLNNTALSPEQQNYLEMIRLSGTSLLGILNDVLDFSKIEAGRMELSPAPFQLGDVLEAIATIMTVNAGEKDLELAIGVEPGVPQALLGDGHRLQQILVNLVGNAIKFTERGAVSLLVEQLAATESAPLQLRFTVRDSGIGIDPQRLAQLFAPFSQADASMTRRFGGTGLGLAISRRMASLMGGAIDVRSTSGAGSEFILTVPLGAAAPAEQPPHATDGGPPQRVLVIDDDAVSAAYLCKSIRAHGWLADSAASGAEALALLQGALARPDLVLVDWNMPGMSGLAAMQAVRAALTAASSSAVTVALMVSAFGQGRLLDTDGAQGADAVLLKPVTAARLADALQQVQAARHGAPAASSAASALPTAAAAAPRADGVRLDGVRILLVEDNPLNQLVARSMLAHAGALVDSADNGKAALEQLRSDAGRYDVVLMDIQMPEMDGFEAAARIRGELKLTMPVLAMTAGVMESEREQCIASGMNDFIAKPIDVEQMLRVIARNLPSA